MTIPARPPLHDSQSKWRPLLNADAAAQIGLPVANIGPLLDHTEELLRSSSSDPQLDWAETRRLLGCARLREAGLVAGAAKLGWSPETLAAGLKGLRALLGASAQDLLQTESDERKIAEHYDGRILAELLQNLHDAVAAVTGHPAIGRFGLGIKSLATVADAIRLDSGPFRLMWSPEIARTLRVDFRNGNRPMALFAYPLPMCGADELPIPAATRALLQQQTDVLVGLADDDEGRTWLFTGHRGLAFRPDDIDSFSARGNSGKVATATAPGPPVAGDTFLAFRLLPKHVAALAEEIERLDARVLLGLSAVTKIVVWHKDIVRELRVKVEAKADGVEQLILAPGDEVWFRVREALEGERSSRTLALPVVESTEVEHLWSWFRIDEVSTGLPFWLHDGGLRLTDDRKRLSLRGDELTANDVCLRDLGTFAAAAIERIAKRLLDVDGLPNPDTITLAARMPLAILPLTGSSASPVAQLKDSQSAGEVLRAAYVAALKTTCAPVIACASADGTVILKSPSCALVLPLSEIDRAAKLASAFAGAVGRWPAHPGVARLLRQGAPGDTSGRWLPDLWILGREDLATSERLLNTLASLVSGQVGEVGLVSALVPIERGTAKGDVALALWSVFDSAESKTPIGFNKSLPVPVIDGARALPGMEVLLSGSMEKGNSAARIASDIAFALGELGLQLAASLPPLAETQLRHMGARDATAEDVLDALADQASLPKQPPTIESAEGALRVAWALLQKTEWLLTQRPAASVLVDLVRLAGVLDITDNWTRGRNPRIAWPGAGCPGRVRVSLSRLLVPTVSGNLRAIGDLSLSSQSGIPSQLCADVPRVAQSLGIGLEQCSLFLASSGAWSEMPLRISLRRLGGQFKDVAFETHYAEIVASLPMWTRALPNGPVRGRMRDEQLPNLRLPLAVDSMPQMRCVNRHGERWAFVPPGEPGDQPVAIVDAPAELCVGEAIGSAEAARRLLETMSTAEPDGRDGALSWAWFANVDDTRAGYKAWNLRVGAKGNVASPLLWRLRQTAFLPLDSKSSAAWLLGTTDAVPARVAIAWSGAHLEQSPVRFLPVVTVDGERHATLQLTRAPVELVDSTHEVSDPRWVLAMLFRLRRAVRDRPEGAPSADELTGAVGRLYDHLARALGMTGANEMNDVPHPGETWPAFYKRAEKQNLDSVKVARTISAWIADVVEMGFASPAELGFDAGDFGEWPVYPGATAPFAPLDNLPLLIRNGANACFTSLAEAQGGRSPVASDEPAEVQRRIESSRGRLVLPRESRRLARSLRLPLFSPGAAPAATPGIRPTWADGFEHAVQRMLPWLIGLTSSVAQRASAEGLTERAGSGPLWTYVAAVTPAVPLQGFPGETWKAGTDSIFGMHRKAAKRSRAWSSPELQVVGTISGDDVRLALDGLAGPLAESLSLEGAATRMAMAHVLYRCSEKDSWAALTGGSVELPSRLSTFLADNGLIDRILDPVVVPPSGATPSPEENVSARIQWQKWLQEVARTVEGAAALAVLDADDARHFERQFRSWRDNPTENARRLIPAGEPGDDGGQHIVDLFALPPTGESLAAPQSYFGSPELLAKHLSEVARQTNAADFAFLCDQARRPVQVLGQRFHDDRAADAAWNQQCQNLADLAPEVEHTDPKMVTPSGTGSTGTGRGGKSRFSARSSWLGKKGEAYLREQLERTDRGRILPSSLQPPADADVRVLAVPDLASTMAARADEQVSAWLAGTKVRAWPGFDLLIGWPNDNGAMVWHGVEVKTTDAALGTTVDFEWTANEYSAAAREADAWPIAGYHIACVGRLGALRGGQLLAPQIRWLSEPTELERTRQLACLPTVRYRVKAVW